MSFAGGVAAKTTPFFTVEITPATPIADEPIQIVVRTWEDADHTIPASLDAVAAVDRLLVVRAADGAGTDIPVPLRLREPGHFEGSVTLRPGEWQVVAFPDRTGWATPAVPIGYPDTIGLTVQQPGVPLPAIMIPFVGIAAFLAAVALRNHRRRSLPGDVADPPHV